MMTKNQIDRDIEKAVAKIAEQTIKILYGALLAAMEDIGMTELERKIFLDKLEENLRAAAREI